MTSPQTENGFTRIANEILEAIQMYKFSLNEMKIIMCVWRFTYGFNRKSHALSLSFFENHTGLSRTRINTSLKNLIESNVIKRIEDGDAKRTNSYKFNKHYSTWKVEKYAVFNSVQTVTDTSVQIDTVSSVRNDTTPSVQSVTTNSVQTVTDTSVQIDTQERKIKDNIKIKEIKTAAATGISNVVDYSSRNYLKTLLHRFVELRGSGLFTTPVDEKAAMELQESGVPLQTAIDGMEEMFRDYQPKHKHDKIKSLSYCSGRIMDKHFGKGSAKQQERSLFEASPETLERQRKAAENYETKQIDYSDLPF